MTGTAAPASSWKRRWARRILFGSAGVLVLIQLVPYGHRHSNPPVVKEPAWDSPATRATAVRACFDCHSNETLWPWYSHVAPVSWFLQKHIDEGREKLNFSEFQRPQKRAAKAAREVEKNGMPLESYLWIHRDAKIVEPERTEFLKGLRATFGAGEKK